MGARGLDFVVIGAQKCGTTTLFHHLRDHPQVAMPTDKEAPFFSRPDIYSKGVDWFMDHYFGDTNGGRLLGKVTPQYMCVAGTAPRLAAAFPDAKLVAILRDPVERARSQHAMAIRRGLEERSFEEAIEAQLRPDDVIAARALPLRSSSSLPDTYVVWGEYGRALASYFDVFPRENIHVVFSVDLARDPAGVVGGIQDFLGLDRIPPTTLGQSYNVGATKPRIASLFRVARENRAAKALWHLLPMKSRSRISYGYWQWNVRPADAAPQDAPPDPSLVERLRSHYWADEQLLERLLGVAVPWPRRTPLVT